MILIFHKAWSLQVVIETQEIIGSSLEWGGEEGEDIFHDRIIGYVFLMLQDD